MIRKSETPLNTTLFFNVYRKHIYEYCRGTHHDGYGIIDVTNSGEFVPFHGYNTQVQTVKLFNSNDFDYVEAHVYLDKVVDDEDQVSIYLSIDNGYTWSTGSPPGRIHKPENSSIYGYTWSTTTNVPYPSLIRHASCGTVNNTLVVGGYKDESGRMESNYTHIFDGNTWISGSLLPTGTGDLAVCGDKFNALCFGGITNSVDGLPVEFSYFWDGSVWTAVSSLNTARHSLAGCGTSTDALAFGGTTAKFSYKETEPVPGGETNITEIWDGSIWATTSNQIVSTSYNAGCGSTSSALSVSNDHCEIWNGAVWSTKQQPFTSSNYPRVAGQTTDDVLYFSDDCCSVLQTLNGVWATTTALLVQTSFSSGNGSALGALSISGAERRVVSTVQKYSQTNAYAKLKFEIPSSYDTYVWVTTSSMQRKVSNQSVFGNGQSCLSAGGQESQSSTGFVNYVEGFNSYIWSTTTSTACKREYSIGVGNKRISGFVIAGFGYTSSTSSGNTYQYLPSVDKWSELYYYSGGTWATAQALAQRRAYLAGCGTTSACLVFGGFTGTVPTATVYTPLNRTDKWNGSSWSVTTAMPAALCGMVGCGDVNAALAFGGKTVYNVRPHLNTCLKWASSTWVTTSSLLYGTDSHSGFGDATNAVCLGTRSNDDLTGYCDSTACQYWNNNIWSTTSTLPEYRIDSSGCGTSQQGLVCGGRLYVDGPSLNTHAYTKNTYKWKKVNSFAGFFAHFR